MRKLLNTLYVTSEDAYLALKGETADVLFDDGTSKQIPLHTIESIVCFSYKGASPAFMGKCAENGIALSFFTPTGRYLASVGSNVNGNVLLRRAQFRIADDETVALSFAKSFIAGKLYNAKYVLLRCLRDHPLQVDCEKLQSAADAIQNYLSALKDAESAEVLRGIEGNAAAEYFGVFNELILQNKTDFYFEGRSRRPPLDNVNA
ncbi:MAG: CRISPR-associated endonuclease Cas1, partial [Clostridia bacterium]|nr:CRISPR-associated endonuclease Cas1 [Clostridia bacterium]